MNRRCYKCGGSIPPGQLPVTSRRLPDQGGAQIVRETYCCPQCNTAVTRDRRVSYGSTGRIAPGRFDPRLAQGE
jgi:hypothetical protein